MAVDGEEKVGTAARAFDVDAEAFIGFFEEECVGFGGTEDVAIETVGALGNFVFDCVEEGLVVGSPGGARGAFDFEGQECIGGEILYLKCVLAEAGNVGGAGEELVVVADFEGTEAEEAVAFGEGV